MHSVESRSPPDVQDQFHNTSDVKCQCQSENPANTNVTGMLSLVQGYSIKIQRRPVRESKAKVKDIKKSNLLYDSVPFMLK